MTFDMNITFGSGIGIARLGRAVRRYPLRVSNSNAMIVRKLHLTFVTGVDILEAHSRFPNNEVAMNHHVRIRPLLYVILITGLTLPPTLYGQVTPAFQSPSNHMVGSDPAEQDSSQKGTGHIVTDVVRKVDSLQLVIVYNADLVRNDLNNKLIWIYILLGGMVISNVMMYAAFNQIRKQSQENEDGLRIQLSELHGKTTTIANNLESKEAAGGTKTVRKEPKQRSKTTRKS